MESGKKTLTLKEIKEIGDRIAKEWADKGKLIEGGWQVFLAVGLHEASDIQRKEMRKAYFLGAQHLYASIIGVMDDDREPTDADMKRMELIDRELRAFGNDLMREMMGDTH